MFATSQAFKIDESFLLEFSRKIVAHRYVYFQVTQAKELSVIESSKKGIFELIRVEEDGSETTIGSTDDRDELIAMILESKPSLKGAF